MILFVSVWRIQTSFSVFQEALLVLELPAALSWDSQDAPNCVTQKRFKKTATDDRKPRSLNRSSVISVDRTTSWGLQGSEKGCMPTFLLQQDSALSFLALFALHCMHYCFDETLAPEAPTSCGYKRFSHSYSGRLHHEGMFFDRSLKRLLIDLESLPAWSRPPMCPMSRHLQRG